MITRFSGLQQNSANWIMTLLLAEQLIFNRAQLTHASLSNVNALKREIVPDAINVINPCHQSMLNTRRLWSRDWERSLSFCAFKSNTQIPSF